MPPESLVKASLIATVWNKKCAWWRTCWRSWAVPCRSLAAAAARGEGTEGVTGEREQRKNERGGEGWWHLLTRGSGGTGRRLGLSPQNVAYIAPPWNRLVKNRVWFVRNFQILIVSAVKICKQCPQTAITSVLQSWAIAPKWKIVLPPLTRGWSPLFSETGNGNILAADWAVLAKFGIRIRIDSDVLKCDTSPTLKPEVDLRRRCRHLGDRRDVTSPEPSV